MDGATRRKVEAIGSKVEMGVEGGERLIISALFNLGTKQSLMQE